MNIRQKINYQHRAGFTLAELILAMSVMTVILAAAATLAFAMGSAESATNKMGEKQARLRFSTMRIRELARNSCMVFTTINGVVFWKDDANGNGVINGNEIAWLSTNGVKGIGTAVIIMEFPNTMMPVTKDELQNGTGLSMLRNFTDEQTMFLFADCTSSSITLDSSNEVVTVDFSVIENNEIKEYQICGMIRASADYLLTAYGDMITGDDDL